MNIIKLIIWREFFTRVRKPSFLIMTLLGPILIAGGAMFAAYLGMQDSNDHRVLVIDPNQVIATKLTDADNISFFVDHTPWSDSLFAQSPYTVMVRFTDEITDPTAMIYYKELPNLAVQRTVSNELEKAIELVKLRTEGVDAEAYRRVRKQLITKWVDIDNVGVESLEQERAGIGFFFGYFMFIFIFMYGVQVMRGVMEEKQNRIVEVLISSVKPFQLMMGKIIGIACVGFTQFVLWIVITTLLVTVGSVVLLKDKLNAKAIAEMPMTPQVQKQLQGELEASGVDEEDVKLFKAAKMIDLPLTLTAFFLYFIGGYLLYSSLLAAVGSAVDSEAETQQFMLPVTVPMIIALLIAQIAVFNPNSPAVLWCSFIPFTSPIVMMVRVAMGNAPLWQLALSILILIGTFIATTWLAGRIYRTGILMYGKKASWKELGKWLFYKG
ncbi:MAG: ABC transporter permease [Flavobacteriales bacterium]|nr:ABC transporter permease [Flavobacteriales bacterium]